MKKHKSKIIAGVAVAIALTGAWLLGGDADVYVPAPVQAPVAQIAQIAQIEQIDRCSPTGASSFFVSFRYLWRFFA